MDKGIPASGNKKVNACVPPLQGQTSKANVPYVYAERESPRHKETVKS